jgi:hypothetical protein
MQNILTIRNKFFLLLGFILIFSPAIATSAEDICTKSVKSHQMARNKDGVASRFCFDKNEVSLKYFFKERNVSFSIKNKNFLLDKIPAGFNPEMVGAEKYFIILPENLQPYISRNILLYMSAIRTTSGKGGGQCGSGAEIYLNTLDLSSKRPVTLSKILIASCSKNIELMDSESPTNGLGYFSVDDGNLLINFLSYENLDGNPRARLSTNFKEIEFLKK